MAAILAAAPAAYPQGRAPAQPQAQAQAPAGELDAFFRSQPPLQADEIPVAADALRLTAQNASDDQIDRLAARHGVSKERLDFIVTKVSAAIILIARPGDADEAARAAGTREALPTPAELELVRPHYDSLAPLFPGLKK
jgi:hypothetical protein